MSCSDPIPAPRSGAGRDAGRGAYGLRVTGLLDGAEQMVSGVPDHLPAVHMAYCADPPPRGISRSFGEEQLTVVFDSDRALVVDRRSAIAMHYGRDLPTPADAIHPLLTMSAAGIGRWHGYELLHAAAFVLEGRVWALLGEKEGGKSSIAAWLASRGLPVVCDDMLVVHGSAAFAGPRCLDLRPEPSERLGLGEPVETRSPRERRRLLLPPIDAKLELGGWIMLTWADAIDVVPVPPRQLQRRLGDSRVWQGSATDPVRLLKLASLPAFELRRPKGWASFEPAASILLRTIEAAAQRSARRASVSHR